MYEVSGYCNGIIGSVCISVRMNAVPKTKQVRIKGFVGFIAMLSPQFEIRIVLQKDLNTVRIK